MAYTTWTHAGRVFNSIGRPALFIRTFAGWVIEPDGTLTPGYSVAGGLLDCPQTRTLETAKQSILHTTGQGGSRAEWMQHVWLSGSFDFPHVSWEAAQVLMKAYETEQSGLPADTYPPEAPLVLLAIFSLDDPFIFPVRLTGTLAFPHVGDKIGLAQRTTVSWQAMQSLYAMKTTFRPRYAGSTVIGFTEETLDTPPTIDEIWYAHDNEELRSW